MKQSNCKSENVRAGTQRQACRRVPACPCTTHRAEPIPLPLHPLTLPFEGLPFTLSIPSRTHTDNLIFVRRRRNAEDTEALLRFEQQILFLGNIDSGSPEAGPVAQLA